MNIPLKINEKKKLLKPTIETHESCYKEIDRRTVSDNTEFHSRSYLMEKSSLVSKLRIIFSEDITFFKSMNKKPNLSSACVVHESKFFSRNISEVFYFERQAKI